jgi:hypothetical protein
MSTCRSTLMNSRSDTTGAARRWRRSSRYSVLEPSRLPATYLQIVSHGSNPNLTLLS